MIQLKILYTMHERRYNVATYVSCFTMQCFEKGIKILAAFNWFIY
jgi:hypothetical protein